MKKLILFVLFCVGCSTAPAPKTPEPPQCPSVAPAPPAPPCEDKVFVMDEKGVTCPSNTRATFPTTYGFMQPGKVVVLCQCK